MASGEVASGHDKGSIAVIGGGLVGSLQAILLANRGYNVNLFETRKDIRQYDPGRGRSINLALSHRGREALRAIDCEEEIVSTAIPMYARMIHSLSGKTSSQPYGTNGEAILSVDRQKLNEFLLSKAESNSNVRIHFQHKLVRADLKKQILTFQVPTNEQGQQVGEGERQFNFQFTFGCDGSYSTIRRQMMRWSRLNYLQEYIEHGYKELTMPPGPDGGYAMPKNYLHIWPRNEFMMIALPNQDCSFTVTLFMPFKEFERIEIEEDLLTFFKNHFPDSISKIGPENLVHDFFTNPTGAMVSVKCSPHYFSSTLLLGDAAHAIVPFYGQGMNAGFEDCLVFDECLGCHGNLSKAAEQYSNTRLVDTHTIADLSMYNYIEMRSLVNSRLFLVQKMIDNLMHFLFPSKFVPLYTMVAFTRIPYHEVVERRRWQKKVIKRGIVILVGGAGALACYLALRYCPMNLPSLTFSIKF